MAKALSDSLRAISLDPVQKRAILKVAIELVKADGRIHSLEISILDNLQADLSMSQDEIDLVHFTSLRSAVETIKSMEDEPKAKVLTLFSDIVRVDSDIDFEENLLLSSIVMSCDNASCSWASVLTAEKMDMDAPARQIIYLEKEHDTAAHRILEDRYDNLLITKTFCDAGFKFFYLPDVIGNLGMALLRKSMEYLMPAGDQLKVRNLEKTLSEYDICTFFRVFISRFGLDPDFFPYKAFLLVKIHDSYLLDDGGNMQPVMDFLCLDMTADVKGRILEFVSRFDEQTYQLPYEGYYQLLYDDLSSESKIKSRILIDSAMDFRLEDINFEKLSFESSPQARTLYLLLLRYGRCGISQELFTKAIDLLKSVDAEEFMQDGLFLYDTFLHRLSKDGRTESTLVYDAFLIYQAISTKDVQKPSFLNYLLNIFQHRSSLKTYVNKGFASVPKLSDKEQYNISFDSEFGAYKVAVSPSLFDMKLPDGRIVPICDTGFWESLI